MFVGRLDEIEKLKRGLFQTKNNHSTNFLITGERGIGKTSLMMYLKYLSSGKLNSNHFNFLTINLAITKNSTLGGFIENIRKKLIANLPKLTK